MAIEAKSSIKSNFETGDKPSQADFVNLIDTAIPDWQEAATSAVQAGNTGAVIVTASASATVSPAGALGLKVLSAATTASGIGSLGGGAAGIQILSAATTASAQEALGGGTVGIQLYTADTTASANNILSGLVTVSVATEAEMSAAAVSGKFASPQNLVHHPGVPPVVMTFNGSAAASIKSNFGVSAVSRPGTGIYDITFKSAFANANYTISLTGQNLSGAEQPDVLEVETTSVSVSAVRIVSRNSNTAALRDNGRISVVVWGDLA